ncbi:MAG: metal-dependent transcriptional regulator [Cytophagaceae bacterium]|nr:metal-dependent transcriptional regulator [Cytophagaceae bacterium]
MLTFVEENYLKAIYHLSIESNDKVTTNSIAAQIQTTPGSVTEMIKKLSTKKLIKHEKYQGVILTEEGKKVALGIIRKHRLWEVFLVNKLAFAWDEVHEIAEQLEHIQSDKLIEKLDKFLGHPTTDPHGDPIPDVNGKIKQLKKYSISELGIGEGGILIAVKKSNPELLRYLDKLGIVIGEKIKVMDIIEFDGSMQINFNKKLLIISSEIAKNLLIQKAY